MRLLIVVMDHQHKNDVRRVLSAKSYGATVLESTGGFLGRGSATMLMVVEDDKVDDAIDTIRQVASPLELEGDGGRRGVVGTNVFVVPVATYRKT